MSLYILWSNAMVVYSTPPLPPPIILDMSHIICPHFHLPSVSRLILYLPYLCSTSLAERQCVPCYCWWRCPQKQQISVASLSSMEAICQGFNTHIQRLHYHSSLILSLLLTDDYSMCCFIMPLFNLCVCMCVIPMTAVCGI